MYTIIHSSSIRTILTEHAPTLLSALLIAELFYKFHSFTLECLAFLGTWYLIDSLRYLIMNKLVRKKI